MVGWGGSEALNSVDDEGLRHGTDITRTKALDRANAGFGHDLTFLTTNR